MKSTEYTTSVNILVAATIVDNQVQIVDRYGRALTDKIDRRLLGRLVTDSTSPESQWRKALKKQYSRIKPRPARTSSDRSAWVIKCNTLAASFRRRKLDIQRSTSRQRGEKYKTTSWESAAKRLWQQGNNRMRHFERSGWHRWSITVANNHNKRVGGRYARS